MEKLWTDDAWDEYLYWQAHDKKTLKRINALIKDIERNGADNGIGKPERLKHQPSWSRRIDEKTGLRTASTTSALSISYLAKAIMRTESENAAQTRAAFYIA